MYFQLYPVETFQDLLRATKIGDLETMLYHDPGKEGCDLCDAVGVELTRRYEHEEAEDAKAGVPGNEGSS